MTEDKKEKKKKRKVLLSTKASEKLQKEIDIELQDCTEKAISSLLEKEGKEEKDNDGRPA